MTWSIIARDASGAFGVAIATRFFAVGALCPHAESGVGALSTQALVNPHYGRQGLELLRAGVPASEVVKRLTAPDEGRDQRQVHVIDAAGRIGQHTGKSCVDWCGALAGDGYSVAGNMLANQRVIQQTARIFEELIEKPFAERLIAALEAGEAAGGDKRGKQSAALLIHSTEDYAEIDLRVDDHAEPLAELRRLYAKAHERFVPYLRCGPSKARPWGVLDRQEIEKQISEYESPAPALLEVRGLRTLFSGEQGEVRAVDGVDLRLERGRTLGIVGESGCGKSVTALSIMGLVPQPPGRVGGEVLFEGEDLLKVPAQRLRDLRGDQLSMIFQEPMTSLNPAFPVGEQIAEALLRHRDISRNEAKNNAVEMLRRVRIPSPERRAGEYPHQLSGGMRQRVMIAMALACNPKLLIADEPTTALDVTIQAQILELMRALRAELGTAIILITHDLGVIAELADDVIVMYAGQVIERCSVPQLFSEPQHPYTVGLLGSIPRLDLDQKRLSAIEGFVPDAAAMPAGCRFHPRCPFAVEKCLQEIPPLIEIKKDHYAACWRAPL